MIRFFIIMGVFCAGQTVAPTAERLDDEVRRLVVQLDALQLAEREAAEVELLARGPDVLDWLPADDEASSAEVRQRLRRIRTRLQLSASEAVARASTITLRGNALPLSNILKEFQKQSNNAIVDVRPRFGQPVVDLALDADFDRTPFWPALDRLMDRAGLTVYPYVGRRAIGVVAAPERHSSRFGRASYRGPFRFEPVAIVAKRDPRDAERGLLTVTLEAAWEPRLRLISLMHRMADVKAVDPQGNPLEVADHEAQPEITVGDQASAVRFSVPLRLPSRDVKQIARLAGNMSATMAGRVETFRFERLSDAQNIRRRIAGVTIVLEQVRLNGPRREVRLRVRYDEVGDALASYRQWILDNPAYLETSDDRRIAPESRELIGQSEKEAGVAFFFPADRPLSELNFVYQTPGALIVENFDYELKDIPLP